MIVINVSPQVKYSTWPSNCDKLYKVSAQCPRFKYSNVAYVALGEDNVMNAKLIYYVDVLIIDQTIIVWGDRWVVSHNQLNCNTATGSRLYHIRNIYSPSGFKFKNYILVYRQCPSPLAYWARWQSTSAMCSAPVGLLNVVGNISPNIFSFGLQSWPVWSFVQVVELHIYIRVADPWTIDEEAPW